jgi:hypothetical protein
MLKLDFLLMPRTRKKVRPKTARERMQARRDRLRRQGLRPVQHWVPDLREPRVRQAIRKEVAILAEHQGNDAIDEWLEAVYAGVEDR